MTQLIYTGNKPRPTPGLRPYGIPALTPGKTYEVPDDQADELLAKVPELKRS